MLHHFCVEAAKQYGVNCALLLHHIDYWVEYNRKLPVYFK